MVRKRDLSLRALAVYEGLLGSDAEQLVPVLLMLAAACGSMGDGVRVLPHHPTMNNCNTITVSQEGDA